MAIEKSIENAKEEVAAGRYWRAKEILRSSLGSYGYEPTLYLYLGEVLLAMKDDMEAGRCFFISVDEPNKRQREVIDIYLKRHDKKGYQGLLKSLPTSARLPDLSEYPIYAQKKFRELGSPEKLFNKTNENSKTSLSDYVIGGGCLVIVIFLSVCCLLGIIALFEAIF